MKKPQNDRRRKSTDGTTQCNTMSFTVILTKKQYMFVRERAFKNDICKSEYIRRLLKKDIKDFCAENAESPSDKGHVGAKHIVNSPLIQLKHGTSWSGPNLRDW